MFMSSDTSAASGSQPMLGRVRELGREDGVALPMVLIFLAFTSVVMAGFLTYSSTLSRIVAKDSEALLSRYAGESSVLAIFPSLYEGADALSQSFAIPELSENGYPVVVAISTPSPVTKPPSEYRYVDPGSALGLAVLPKGSHYYLQIDHVPAGSGIGVNWAFTPIESRWRMRVFAGSGPPGAPPPITVAADGFEGGNFGSGAASGLGWFKAGNAEVITTKNPHAGTTHVAVRGGNGRLYRWIDLSGRTNMRLQFWLRAESFEKGETATLSVSPDGVTWTTVRTWYDREDTSTYLFEDIDLSGFAMTSKFWISFDAHMSTGDDSIFVDDVEFRQQIVPAPIANVVGVGGPAHIFVNPSVVAGGQYTIDFVNESPADLHSAPFDPLGDVGKTWIYSRAHQDYVIASTADDRTLQVYARQIPGPTTPIVPQVVEVLSWREPVSGTPIAPTPTP